MARRITSLVAAEVQRDQAPARMPVNILRQIFVGLHRKRKLSAMLLCRKSATRRHMQCSKSCSLFDHLVGPGQPVAGRQSDD
jgi:hypothetical protein